MGIFSFGRKRAEAAPRRGGATPGTRAGERDARDDDSEATAARAARLAAARGRPARKVGQEAMLDPTLPEKQRARRRLVGAVALVLAAVVILPMVLDARPKPVTDGIAISIPAQDTPAARTGARHGVVARDADADVANPGEAAAPDAAPGTTELRGTAAPGSAAADTGTDAAGGDAARGVSRLAANAKPDAKAPTSGAALKAPSPPPSAKAGRPAPAEAAAPAAPPPSIPTPATPGSRYVVQLGNFVNEATAREWVAKLKNIGVPAYIEHTKQADGTSRAMLRAGPFADRAVAQAAVLKVRQAGLSQAGR